MFSSTKAGNDDIWEYQLKTKQWRQVTSHPARDFSPSYSPDGQSIAFVTEADETSTEDGNADADIWIMSRDGMKERQVTKNSGSDRYVSWSPDGKHIVYCARTKLRNTDRISIISVETDKTVDFSYDRHQLEKEMGAEISQYWHCGIFSIPAPEMVRRLVYPADYFGGERYPHWKA